MFPTIGPCLDLICFSHLRWNFVVQRPQHLMTRCARERRVFFVEEPLFDATDRSWLQVEVSSGVVIATPHLAPGRGEVEARREQRLLLDRLLVEQRISAFIAWYYTPMALAFSDHLNPQVTVYDCMDELSAFANAPATLTAAEASLLERADVVFTGGQSLYEAKRRRHHNVHAFPSSVDVAHFAQARTMTSEPDDQRSIPGPRLGFFGVIDERMDLGLIAGIAQARPQWQLVMLGPVVKIDPTVLPHAPNLHYLGNKRYEELPRYISGWDVALLPFARNDATRFISPTKTPEYLASGKPVVSTSIRDVVNPYGQRGLVRIADCVEEFVAACEAAMREDAATRLRDADAFLRRTSWDGTWSRMRLLVDRALAEPADSADGAVALAAE